MEKLAELHEKLWKVFAEFIKLRDTDNQGFGHCISCSRRIAMKGSHCGHFIARTYSGTRYEELNNHLQCVTCNIYKEGNPIGYKNTLVLKYGPGIIEALETKKRVSRSWNRETLQESINYYKQCNALIKQIKNRGGSLPDVFFKMEVHHLP